MNKWMNEWMNEWMDEWYEWMNEWMNGWLDGWMDGWMDGWINGGMNGWMWDGWMDGWMDKLINELQISTPTKSDKPSDEYRMRYEELSQENRLLKRQLTDAQTNLALIRSEVANARSEYEEKCYDLETLATPTSSSIWKRKMENAERGSQMISYIEA